MTKKSETLRNFPYEMSGAYEKTAVTTDQQKSDNIAISRAPILIVRRGLTAKRSTVASNPISHDVCDAAIECGDVTTIRVTNTNAIRSSQRAAPPSSDAPLSSSSRSKNVAINANIVSVNERNN